MTPSLLLLPGDGIGPEVTAEAEKVIRRLKAIGGLALDLSRDLLGGAAIDAHGSPLSEATLARAKSTDAVLMGAVGGPKWDTVGRAIRPERGLLRLRQGLGLFANLRPALCFSALADASSLKRPLIEGLDLMIVRELTGGVYFGEPRGIETLANGERRAVNTQVYTTSEIRRIARVAFELARQRKAAGRPGHVTSVDKANVMESGQLWREEVEALRDSDFPDVALSHMYADNCAMQLLKYPRQFDVIVTDNLFGDILSDEAGMLTGSLGMLPSAALGARVEAAGHQPGLYEPIHGSAPDIAGRGVANPCASILSLAMALRLSLARPDLAAAIERAVESALADGMRTADIASGGPAISTAAMGDAIVERLEV